MPNSYQEETLKLAKTNAGAILGLVFKFANKAYSKFQLSLGTAFNEYLTNAVLKYSEVKTILYKDAPVPLYDFYVHIELSHGEKTILTDDIDNLLKVSKTLIISGLAGMGKSTLLKHLFLNTIKLGDYIPIFVELRHINSFNGGLEDYIYSQFQNLHFDLEKQYFLETFKKGKIVLFVDGYDELDPEIRIKITEELLDMCDRYSDSCFIVSSRPEERFVGWQRFTELKVKGMSQPQALELINKLAYDPEVKANFAKELKDSLYQAHKSFASNPLLLTILLLTYSQCSCVPERISVFYGQAFEALYLRHDSTKGTYKRKRYTDLGMDSFKIALSCFSLQSYLEHKVSFSFEEVMNYLNKTKQITCIAFNEEAFLEDLLKSVCILLQDGLHYTFTHRSFQEYFTAIYITTLPDDLQKDILYSILGHNTNVFQLLMELDSVRLERNLIIPTLKRIKKETEYGVISEDEALLNYFKSQYSAISKSGNDRLGFSIKHDFRDSLAIRFYYDTNGRSREKYFSNGKIKEFCQCVLKDKNHVSIDEVLSDTNTVEKLKDILRMIFPEYAFAMQSLDSLIKKHNKQKKTVQEMLLSARMSV